MTRHFRVTFLLLLRHPSFYQPPQREHTRLRDSHRKNNHSIGRSDDCCTELVPKQKTPSIARITILTMWCSLPAQTSAAETSTQQTSTASSSSTNTTTTKSMLPRSNTYFSLTAFSDDATTEDGEYWEMIQYGETAEGRKAKWHASGQISLGFKKKRVVERHWSVRGYCQCRESDLTRPRVS